MHLCHINLSKELRGGEIQTIALMECLIGRFEQSVIVRRNGLMHRRLVNGSPAGLEIIAVPSSIPAAFHASRGADLLHVHEGRSVQVGALRSLFRTPFIVTRRVLHRPKSNPAARWCYGRASAIVGVSEAVSTVMRGYIDAGKVVTILDVVPRLIIDEEGAQALRARYRNKIVVGHVGELDDEHKGQGVILEAARMARDDYPDLHFLLVGSGRDEKKLRAQAQDLANVEFVGRVDNVGDYYSAMDLFVFPSREEALGSAILEAMSCGVPVIGSDVGGIPEVVRPDQNGLLFRSGDAAELFRAIVRLARDAALRARLAEGARAMAEGRRVEVVAEQYVSVYERVVAA